MSSDRERIARLEEQMMGLRGSIGVIGAWPVTILEAALDQLVDEGLMTAALRSEIFGRVRKDARALSIASEQLEAGALAAIPRYPTKEDTAITRANLRRIRKPLLEVPKAKPEDAQ